MTAKILLVEDSDTQLKFLRDGLVENGFEVETATNGAEAYKKIFEYIPDIVVSDIMMPVIDGYQLCRMIKNVDEVKKIPVILLTILDKKIDSFWGKKAGAQLFLSKSIDIKELVRNINATLRRYPVSEEYKLALATKATPDSAQTRLNSILNDLLLKSVFANEFRNLSDFLNYERILVEKLFNLMSSFVEYSVAGIYFASPDDFAENILYIDTLGRNLQKSLLSDIQYDFFRKMEEQKPIKDNKFEVVRMLLGKELDYKFTDLNSKIIIPLVFDRKLIGGICFYTRQDIDYASFRYFDIMISELLAIFKMKYQYTEKEFILEQACKLTYSSAEEKGNNGKEQIFSALMHATSGDFDYFTRTNGARAAVANNISPLEIEKLARKTLEKKGYMIKQRRDIYLFYPAYVEYLCEEQRKSKVK